MTTLLVLGMLLAGSAPRLSEHEQYLASCPYDKTPIVRSLNGYTTRISPLPRNIDGHPCQATVARSRQRAALKFDDWVVVIWKGSGKDVNHDGNPDLILLGYSGGAHCCYRYQVVSLGSRIEVLPEVKNQEPLFFVENRRKGRFEIWSWDGAFGYFDDLSYGFSPLPRVILEIRRREIRDISSSFKPVYDGEISKIRGRLQPTKLAAFKTARKLADADLETRRDVLSMVLAYLYSGREQDAWSALDEMWPPADKARIKELILKTRADGILRHVVRAENERH